MIKAINWIKENTFLTVVLLCCFGFGIFYLAEMIKWIPYPNQIDYGEGYIAYINNMWVNGTWKWDMSIPPYIPLMYGVGMPFIAYPFIQIFGNEFWIGRIIMVCSALVICFILYLIVKKATGKTVYGIIAGLLPLTQPIIRDWSLMYRVDMLAVMFSFIGFYLAIKYRSNKYIYLSIIPFVIAIFTKPTAIAGIVAIGIYLLIYNRKVFLKYMAISIVAGSSIFGILQLISNGNYIHHILTFAKTIDIFWNAATLITNLSIVLLPLAIILAIAFGKIVNIIRKRDFNELNVLFVLYLFAAILFNFSTGLRPGGFINYYIEFIIGICLCAAIALPAIIDRAQSDYKNTGKVFKSGFMVLVLLASLCTICLKSSFPFPNDKYTEEVKVVNELIKDTDRPIITENPGLVSNAGKELYAEFFTITNGAELGNWDDTNYVNDFRNSYFDFIILRVPTYKRVNGDLHFKKEIIDLINKNYTLIYEPTENFYWYGLYVYKSNNTMVETDIVQVNGFEITTDESLLSYTSDLSERYDRNAGNFFTFFAEYVKIKVMRVIEQ